MGVNRLLTIRSWPESWEVSRQGSVLRFLNRSSGVSSARRFSGTRLCACSWCSEQGSNPGGQSCICNVKVAVAAQIGWSLDSQRFDLVIYRSLGAAQMITSVNPLCPDNPGWLAKHFTSLTMAAVHKTLREYKRQGLISPVFYSHRRGLETVRTLLVFTVELKRGTAITFYFFLLQFFLNIVSILKKVKP